MTTARAKMTARRDNGPRSTDGLAAGDTDDHHCETCASDEPDRETRATAPGPAAPSRFAAMQGRRRGRVILAILLAVTVVLAGLAFAGFRLLAQIPRNVGHVKNAFEGIPQAERPTKPASAQSGLDFLLLGLDTRAPGPVTGRESESQQWVPETRSDAIMLVHLSGDASRAVVVSLPRDGWVPIDGHGTTKLNAAYGYGGPPLLISTVERITGIRIDHFAQVDFAGFGSIVNAIGGVDVSVAEETKAGNYRLHAGINHLNGDKALAYVRERHAEQEGEFDRMRRQQNLIRAVLTKVAAMKPLQSPLTTYRLLNAATQSITVDDTLTTGRLQELGSQLLALRGGNVAYLNTPVSGVTDEPTPQGILTAVHLDTARGAPLWAAIRDDQVEPYLAAHQSDLLSSAPR